MYAMVCTRPDLSHAVSVVSRFMSKPGKEHWQAVKWILRYVRGTMKTGLNFDGAKEGSEIISSYVDSDFAANINTRKSTRGLVFT